MKQKPLSDFIAGDWVQQLEYKSFRPNRIYEKWLNTDQKTTEYLGQANRMLGALNAYADLVPDIDFFISMHIAKEATTSSKIEGTQTSFEEAFINEEDINPEKRNDWQDVHNYIMAMNYAQGELKNLPISSRLIKKTHKILLESGRGKEKMPGQFRKSQNWIGPSLKRAHFVPPHHEEILEHMADLEKFIHCENESIMVPHLIKIAMIHYQFETIHPFLDGNGRIGRLLITLYLLEKDLLNKPTLYLSDFFERNRADYYDHLTLVRNKNSIELWIRFFLIGVIETAEKSINTFKKIIALRQEIEFEKLPRLLKSQTKAQALIKIMYKKPIMDGKQIAKELEIHASNANKLIKKLIDLSIIKELTGFRRNKIYSFDPYISLFKE